MGGGITDGDEWVGSIGGAFTNTVLAAYAAFEHANGCDWEIGVASYALKSETSYLYTGQKLECEDENSSRTSDDDDTGGGDNGSVCGGD